MSLVDIGLFFSTLFLASGFLLLVFNIRSYYQNVNQQIKNAIILDHSARMAQYINKCTNINTLEPIHICLHYERVKCLKILLQNTQLNINLRNDQGLTPLRLALLRCNNVDLLWLLIQDSRLKITSLDCAVALKGPIVPLLMVLSHPMVPFIMRPLTDKTRVNTINNKRNNCAWKAFKQLHQAGALATSFGFITDPNFKACVWVILLAAQRRGLYLPSELWDNIFQQLYPFEIIQALFYHQFQISG